MPGRFCLGLATGDSSVHAVDLRPQRWDDLEADVARVRAKTPPDMELQLMASGPRGAAVAGRVADALVVGTGVNAGAVRSLARIARAAPAEAGIDRPLAVWAFVLVRVVEDAAEIESTRDATLASAYSGASMSFASTLEGKNIPEDLHADLVEGLRRYDHEAHARPGPDNPNRRLFEHRPDIRDYLLDRMMICGTRQGCAHEVGAFVADAELGGLWISAGGLADNATRLGESLAPLLA